MSEIELVGYVIRVIHFNESSEIIHLLTEYGKISILVKGARRYKSHKLSLCIPLTKVSCKVTDSKIPTLIDYSIINNFDNIKENLKMNLFFSYFLEIINKLPLDSHLKNIYHLIDTIFLKSNNDNYKLLILTAQTKFLHIFGVEPEFNNCVLCGNNDLYTFSIKDGGYLCKNHGILNEDETKAFNDIKRLYYFDIYNSSLSLLDDIDINKVFEYLNKYYMYHVDITIHSINSLIM